MNKIHWDASRPPLWQLIFSRAFDRFPDLEVSLAKLHGELVAPTSAHLERIIEEDRQLARASNR